MVQRSSVLSLSTKPPPWIQFVELIHQGLKAPGICHSQLVGRTLSSRPPSAESKPPFLGVTRAWIKMLYSQSADPNPDYT